jgi:predicted nucleotidyltransferase
MANVQKDFESFDDEIRLGRLTENKTLRDKRDAVLEQLERGIKDLREKGQEIPEYETFAQGSYAMGTGVKPADGDYDIDIGVIFDLAKADRDPVAVKKWVYEALKDHTQRVEVRRSCVTVFYQRNDEPIFHVDLAVYSNSKKNPDGKLYLAKGRLDSEAKYRVWEESDPQGLIDAIDKRFTDADSPQFRRVVRALKRWKTERFVLAGSGAPTGIALTICAYQWFRAAYRVEDVVSQKRRHHDLEALRTLVGAMLSRFVDSVYNETTDDTGRRLSVILPVAPRCDLFAKMTANQMATLETRLKKLKETLDAAETDPDRRTACERLRKQFGDAFPVPPKEDTAQSRGPSVVSGGTSA